MHTFQHLKHLRDLYLVKVKWREYSIGSGFHAGRQVFIYGKSHVKIGRNFYIGRFSEIGCDVDIGDHVLFANFVSLVGKYDHHYETPGVPIRFAPQIRDAQYDWKGIDEKIVVGDDVWVGYRAVIMSGVNIGAGSIIAAGAVVTKDVEPMSIYAGVPARKVGPRFSMPDAAEAHRIALGF